MVGVVPTLRDRLVKNQQQGHIYFPFIKEPTLSLYVHVRSNAPQIDLKKTLATSIRDICPRLPIRSIQSLAEHQNSNFLINGTKFLGAIFVAFGLLALLLASIGLFGVRTHVVSLRTREFGIRMSLGATPKSIQGLVLKEGMVISLFGLAFGAPLSLAVASALNNLLYEVNAFDPIIFVTASGVLLFVTALASLWPAIYASRIQPIEVIRRE